MKLTSSEYRAMMDKGKKEKPEPSGKSGKLDTVAALKALKYFLKSVTSFKNSRIFGYH
jgi:hypothetical protein